MSKAWNSTLKEPTKPMKRSPIRKKRKGTRAALKRKADVLWTEYIHLRDKVCIICGASGRLEAHHMIGRTAIAFRHDPMNGALLCTAHHKFSRYSAHENPAWFAAKMQELYPVRWAWVEEHCHEVLTGTKPDYADICERLQGMIDELLQRD